MSISYEGYDRLSASVFVDKSQAPTNKISFLGQSIYTCEVVNPGDDCNRAISTNGYPFEPLARTVFVWSSRKLAACNCPEFEQRPHFCPHIARALVEYELLEQQEAA